MPDPRPMTEPASAGKRSDAWLWTGLLLGPVAMGINTVVGYTAAHWTADTAQKTPTFLISVIDFCLCLLAFLISLAMHRQFQDAHDDAPIDGRRQFMAKLAMALSLLSALLVVAGTLALILLHPTD